MTATRYHTTIGSHSVVSGVGNGFAPSVKPTNGAPNAAECPNPMISALRVLLTP